MVARSGRELYFLVPARLGLYGGNKLSRRAAFKLLRDHETDGRSFVLLRARGRREGEGERKREGEGETDRRRRYFLFRVNLGRIKFIRSLLRRFGVPDRLRVLALCTKFACAKARKNRALLQCKFLKNRL